MMGFNSPLSGKLCWSAKPDALVITHHERQAIGQPESQDHRLQTSDGYGVDSSQGSLVRHPPIRRHETRD
ncbi:hypothetical protein SB778_35130, partial [Paraburkholderia sp. SIMBA_050]